MARAEPLAAGPGQLICANAGEPITVYTYKPARYSGGPLFVVFHGADRDATDVRNEAIPMAERFGAILAVPLFDAHRFASERYQYGGLVDYQGRAQPRKKWTYLLIPRLVADIRARESAPRLPFYLIGHSAGAQFLMRMAPFFATEASGIVVANPGSDLFPARDRPFGYGFGGLPPEMSDDEVLRAYLAAPLTLYLGADDIHPRPSFDNSPPARNQGPNRLARGRACFACAASLARERGWEFRWRKVEAPGVGHSTARMYAAPQMAEALNLAPVSSR